MLWEVLRRIVLEFMRCAFQYDIRIVGLKLILIWSLV